MSVEPLSPLSTETLLATAWNEHYTPLVNWLRSQARGHKMGNEAAEDVAATTFERLAEQVNAGRFVANNLRGWLFTVAQRELALQASRHRREVTYAEQFGGLTGDDDEAGLADRHDVWLMMAGANPREAAMAAERAEALHRALDELPATYAEVIQLHHFDEVTVVDIARHKQVGRMAIQQRVCRGRKALARALAQQGLSPADLSSHAA